MTDVQICNYALLLIGDTEGISSMTENTKASKVCARVYEIERETLLTEFPWNFVVKQALLVEVTGETSQEFNFVYEYPGDCLRVLKIFTGSETDGMVNDYKIIYTKDANDNVKRIVCNLDDAYVEYIMDMQDENADSAIFSKLLAYRIAVEIAIPLTGDARIAQSARQGYAEVLAKTKYLTALERQQPVNKGNRYMTARR
jgi:hypothetical protein